MPPARSRRAAATAALLAASAIPTGCASPAMSAVDVAPWGSVRGRPVEVYRLENHRGTVCVITSYGATVTQLWLPDRDGRLADVVLGFDSVQDYVDHSPYFGCIVGRCANRIAGGAFELDGERYELATNNGPNHLHGGMRGFDKVVWERLRTTTTGRGPSVELRYRSPDGEEGYPGNLEVTVAYTLTHDDALEVVMTAATDRATIVNLAHHGYWNLAGHDQGTILDHELELACSRYTPTDATLIPTGELAPVGGTPLDFRRPKAIGADLAALQAQRDAGHGGGYDLNFAVDGSGGDAVREVATLYDPSSGRVMRLSSDQPGVQLYTGNFLDGTVVGKGGAVYRQYAALCLETQRYPDAVHHPAFPPVVLRPGETYRHVMRHEFSTR